MDLWRDITHASGGIRRTKTTSTWAAPHCAGEMPQ